MINKLSLEKFTKFASAANERSTLDLKDGCKPIHRRIMYIAKDKGMLSNKEFKKSASLVGDVLGRVHPHGDAAIYDAAVRLSQPFKMRYPLMEMYGNGGSILEPTYASSRYTSIRLSPLGEFMLKDINKNTIEWVDNYSGEEQEPLYLPASIPNLLLNGGMGIGLGVANSIVPHQLGEVCDGLKHLLDNPSASVKDIMNFIPAPDFPTGGTIINPDKLEEIYQTGKGTIKVRAKYHTTSEKGKTHIVITEIPFMVDYERGVIDKIKKMAEEGYDQIYDLVDNSGKQGIELHIVLEKGASLTKTLKKLFSETSLEKTVSINNTVFNNGKTEVKTMLELMRHYIKMQHQFITRASQYDLNKAAGSLEILNGLVIALNNIDKVVAIMKSNNNKGTAVLELTKAFNLTTAQANAIAELKLYRLTALEIDTLNRDIKALEEEVVKLKDIIENESTRIKMIKEHLSLLKRKFNDTRRTEIKTVQEVAMNKEQLIVTVDSNGAIKTMASAGLELGTKTKRGKKIGSTDIKFAIAVDNDKQLAFVNTSAEMYTLNVSDLEENDHAANYDIVGDIASVFVVQEKTHFLTISKNGQAKISAASNYKNLKKGTPVCKLKAEDELFYADFVDKDETILVFTPERQMSYTFEDIKLGGRATVGTKLIKDKPILSVAHSSKNNIFSTSGETMKISALEDFKSSCKSVGVTFAVQVEGERVCNFYEGGYVNAFAASDLGTKTPGAKGLTTPSKVLMSVVY